MKTLPTALATHYASGTTTLADLLKITRKDGQVFAFTSASTDVTISGQLYTSAQGLDISSMEVTAGLAVDNLELTTLDDGTIFSRVEVLAGVWRNADFVISRYNWASPSDGVEVRMVGTVGEVHLKRGSITAELRGLQQYLQQPIGSVTSKTCRARLGDSLCRVNMAGYTFTGSVSAVETNQVFSDATKTGDSYFASVSALLFFDGANNSTSFTDSSAVPKTFTRVGSPVVTTSQSKFGGSSMLVGNAVSGNYLSATHSDFVVAADVTVECFVRFNLIATQFVWCFGSNANSANGCGLAQTFGQLSWYVAGSTRISGPSVTVGQWYHVAITRTGGVWRMFVDGVSVGTYSNATALNEGILTVGGRPSVSLSMAGYLDEFRFTNGSSRHPASGFSVPLSAYPSQAEIFAPDYFAEGLLTWNSGTSAGLSQKVKSFQNGALQLSLPMLQSIQPGDTYTITAGCQKRLSDCSGKFANAINFQGEPHLPGIDAVTS